ncbi:hypothetical protein L873DRAFT_1814268 [Choiromyces venosus 120613-1]|uniref:Uncharacterized protein n=1 Tax=Choiromyces venosus 120613-1 TaxID=1336337 RepID=A0A3N4J8C7_9PEZI|nr:hypothetical protein L873DRAFT_1814268 [Choiromyces venosus 120613-1]
MSSLWLAKKRKAELVDFAEQLGLRVDGYLKHDIENLLTDYLDTHSDEYLNDPTFSAYYDTMATRSPVKHTLSVAAISDAPLTRSTRRRTTRYAVESLTENASTAEEESPEPRSTERTLRSGSRSLSTRTPRTVRSLREAAQVPLPPTPAAIADAIESGTNAIRESAKKAVEKVAIQEKAISVRDRLSNVVSVNAVSLVYEAIILLYHLIPFTYTARIPTIPIIENSPKLFLLPDLFVLLTAGFWGPFATWLATAIFIPLANAYFFNLTATAARSSSDTVVSGSGSGEEYRADPLAFAVTKALIAYLVHYKGFEFMGLFNPNNLAIVGGSVGRETQLIGAGIASLAAFWESILKR